MIKRVLIISLVFFIIGLILFWLISGGLSASARTARTLGNPIDYIFGSGTSPGISFRLPWQPASLPQGPDISGDAEVDAQNDAPGNEERGSNASPQPSELRTFGNPSPSAGKITLTDNSATESDATAEYIKIEASGSNTAPIAITNWSLQSAISGLRTYIPQGAPLFVMGVINNVEKVYLEPGASAIVTTSASPVGVSFRENICSGYLGELQTFTPEIGNACPHASETLAKNPQNLQTYSGACFDYLDTLPSCHFPTDLPSELSSTCRSFIANTMSYNGCVNTSRNDPTFALHSWRLFLNMRTELWYNTHDVIRLLDDQGRTVDALTY